MHNLKFNITMSDIKYKKYSMSAVKNLYGSLELLLCDHICLFRDYWDCTYIYLGHINKIICTDNKIIIYLIPEYNKIIELDFSDIEDDFGMIEYRTIYEKKYLNNIHDIYNSIQDKIVNLGLENAIIISYV